MGCLEKRFVIPLRCVISNYLYVIEPCISLTAPLYLTEPCISLTARGNATHLWYPRMYMELAGPVCTFNIFTDHAGRAVAEESRVVQKLCNREGKQHAQLLAWL